MVVIAADLGARAQPVNPVSDSAVDLPNDPFVASGQSSSPSPSSTQTSPPQPAPTTQPQATTPEPTATSEEQLKQQYHQRVFGVMATFNTTKNRDALPLTTGEKYQLFFRSASDPWPFVLTFVGAGIDQAENSFPQYGQGVEGFAKRWGAGYADYFTGNFLGNAVLAAMLKEDPRYFQKGTGSYTSRVLWAAASTVWCKRDSGTWGPNYANVVGNLMGSAVSNLYYPSQDRTVSGTIGRGFTVTAQAIIGSEVIEFWPDLVRHHRRKQAEKVAKQLGQPPVQDTSPPPPPPAPQR